ncbi:MAG TPA: VOC family protein [Vicinamibacterales bacterium]|nr:VOC family protein [Vicinamibacterales bacterium]
MAEKPRGRFVWFDLMTTDPDRAVGFYPRITGWGTTQLQGSAPYTMWTNKGAPIGGVTRLPAGAAAPPHWLAYISTPDVDATMAQATGLGAAVVSPAADIPNVGRFAVLTDPQGAVFAIFSPAGEAPGHDGEPRRGEFSWHELATNDVPAALQFYQALFGWEAPQAMDMGPGGIYQEYSRAGRHLGGMYKKPSEAAAPPAWLHYILVDDVQRAVETTTDRGGRIVNGPMEVPGGDTIAVGVDPQGAMFALHAKKRR